MENNQSHPNSLKNNTPINHYGDTMDFNDEVKAKGREIFEKMEGSGKSIFNKDWWYGRIMEWSMKNETFKTQMFRFVDVLPYLNSSSEVSKHLKEYFSEGDEKLPSIFNLGVGVGALAPALMAGAVRKNVTQMAKMFIAGENAEEALPKLNSARKKDICFTVDILGEVTLSEKEALEYQSRYIELIDSLAKNSETWDTRPLIDTADGVSLPKVNVSVKLSSIYSQIKSTAWEESKKQLKERLRPILQIAKARGVFINIDMEHYALKNLTLEVFEEIVLEPEFKDYPHVGIVIQAYLRDSFQDVTKMIELAKRRETPFTVRLVKGAYWDYEVIHAEQNDWPIPVYCNKPESDANYELCSRALIDAFPSIRLAIGSHNVRSISSALVYAKRKGLKNSDLEIQMLYGMADQIKSSLIAQDYRIREYVPVGELIPGMAYLVRRLLENTSNESFLKSKFADHESDDALLNDPATGLVQSSETFEKTDIFKNEPLLDFTLPENRKHFKDALQAWPNEFEKIHPIVIGKKEVKTSRTLSSINPSKPSEEIGKVYIASAVEADQAISNSVQTFKEWKNTDAEVRSKYIENLADLIKRDRFRLASLQTLEVGKPFAEADADVTEAIDFCRYYARQMREIAKGHWIGNVSGETTKYRYLPRGVVGVIAPWNFPLAILTGMVTSAVVTGNTVIMKPAEQSSITAASLMKLIQEAGLPPGVVNFLPGFGEEVGDYLVRHKDVQMISFTGSKDVGLAIVKETGNTVPGQRAVKKCIIEMGGKNAVIVDSDADLDEAVAGILYSAFGFAGQKCSACSRAIIVESIYDRFVSRFTEAVKSIKTLPPVDPDAYLGPVIDDEAYKRILHTIENAKKESQLLFQGEVPSEGFFIPPTVFTEVSPDVDIAKNEIFGPVLALIQAKNLDHAIEIANDTIYGLTGGVFSRSPANIEKVKENLEVGNLYINRSITGAMVDRHPFGGLKLSGVGSKTGGPDYLLQFLEPQCITENTMRRGFAPSKEDAKA